MHKTSIYKHYLKHARDGARLARAEIQFHNFTALKKYPFLGTDQFLCLREGRCFLLQMQ